MSLVLDNISIIVVEPKTPGNIGSIARSCQNLGIKNIILINPCDFHVDDAYRFAKNAKPLLFEITTRDKLVDCMKDHHILIGTTQRRRGKQVPFVSPPEMVQKIIPYSQKSRIGIVFGRENHGLSNEELDCCNFQSAIPAHKDNPVFNLSQAVLIYAYECFNASDEDKEPYIRPLATKSEEQFLFERLATIISQISTEDSQRTSRLTNRIKQVLSRIVFEKRDIPLFHKLFEFISGYKTKIHNTKIKKQLWQVYMVECSDKTIYTGITNNLEKRISAHNSQSNGAKYTKGRQPVKLIYSCEVESKSDALKEEYRIKQLTKEEKYKLLD
jgi:TrmH family RNA methyltransferase